MNAGGFVCLFICMVVSLVFEIDNDLVYYKKIESSAVHQNHESSGLWLEILDQYNYTFRRCYTPAPFVQVFTIQENLRKVQSHYERNLKETDL